jgi:hypothetical protein
MAPIATRAAASLNSLAGIFVDPGAVVALPAPVVSLAGFDAIVQLSGRLLQAQVAQSLGQNSLSPLSAYVPWGSVPLPASLLATISLPVRLGLSARPARLELRLVGPYIAGLRWPPVISDGSGGGAARAAAVLQQRFVDIGWRLEINLAMPSPIHATGDAAPSSGPTPAPGLSGTRPPLAGSGQLSTGAPGSGGGSDSGWDRTTLAAGNAVTSARAQVTVPANLWRFAIELDFSETVPAVTSDTAAVTDFVATDAGKNMLAQALAALQAAAGITLTPDIAPAGALSASYVQRMNLPPFSVRDLLLADAKGNPILCLCAQLGAAGGGVARLVQPFLEAEDFAYGVSTNVLSPALKARWNIVASGLSIVANTPVELPVDGDSKKTAPGTAQLQINFSNILDDVAIKASTDQFGDPLRLLSTQTIRLLNLWDQNGKAVTDLGSLAQPQQAPLVLAINLFDRAGAPPSLQPNFKDFLLNLLGIIVFPLLEPFSGNGDSISGFTSSAMNMLFIRWALEPLLDGVRPPGSGTMLETS